MASILDTLTAQVAANTDVIESAITLVRGLKTQLDEAIASNDPAKVQALSDALATEDTKLASAVAESTPAA